MDFLAARLMKWEGNAEMILITRLNGTQYYINAEKIYSVESMPDTVITMSDGSKVIAREKAADVAEKVTAYFRSVRRPYEPGETNC